MNDLERSHWLRLSLAPSIPPSLCALLLQDRESADDIHSLTAAHMQELGINKSAASRILAALYQPSDVTKREVDTALNWSAQANNYVITLGDPQYPPLLREIPDPPLVLYVSGQLPALLAPQIAIVGSRACSVDGKRNAAWLGASLAQMGFSIVSGLAHGIDTCAHAAAVQADGTSVAVMGTGADIIYPQLNMRLAQKLQEQGALLTEMPLGSRPMPSHFPKRNRIISGMSLALVVVEAAPKSGSLISARLAMEQGREVFAVPGSIRNAKTKGCHQLIRDGAQILDSVDQIVEAVKPMLTSQVCALESEGGKIVSNESDPKSEEERAVLQVIGYDPISIDQLVVSTGVEVSTLQSLLLRLELKGNIKCLGGTYALA